MQQGMIVVFTYGYDNNKEVMDRCEELAKELYDGTGHAIVMSVPPVISGAMVKDLQVVAVQLYANGFMTTDLVTTQNIMHILGKDN